MNSEEWRNRIVESCKASGSYQVFFDDVIDTLAIILEKRDDAQQRYVKSGSKPIVKRINKAGAENLEQNPLLRMINDLNRDALTYWKELGLTARAWKDVTGEKANAGKTKNALMDALKELK